MKALFLCLLILGHAGVSKITKSRPKPGGVSVLTIDAATSSVGWEVEKVTGKHTGTVKVRSGSLTMHCGQLAKGTVVLDMTTLNVSDLSAPDKQKLENNLKSDYFFDTGRFPQARLDITNVDCSSQATLHIVKVSGNLVMHGITKPVTFNADVSKSSYTDFSARADFIIDRRDWEIATNNFKYDNLINREIHLHVTLQAKAEQQITSL